MDKYVVVDQALMCERPAEELALLARTGVLEQIYPEVAEMVGFGGSGTGHKDLWWHTKKVVAQSPPVRAVRWAALFHDVGKVRTFSRAGGKVSFHGHEVVSARQFEKAAKRTDLDTDLRKGVSSLIRHLGQVESYEPEWTDSAVRRLYKQLGDHWDDAVALACADITTKHDHKRRAHRARMGELDERAKALAKKDAELPLLPKGLGSVVIRELGLTPGPEVGLVMKELEEAAKRGDVPPRADPEVYVAYLRERR